MAVANMEYDPTFPPIEIKYKGHFNLGAVYQKIWYWCQNEGYVGKYGKSINTFETLYRERTYPGFSEFWVIWEMEKELNKYIKHEITLKIQILYKSKIELVIDGKKVKRDTGEIIVNIKGEITFDEKMTKEWDKPIFNRFPFNVIRKTFKIRTIKDTIDYWEDKRFPKHFDLANTIKAALGMKL